MLLIVAVVLTASSLALGQDTVTGAFQGDVSNNRTGDPVGGAAVQITSVQTGTVYNLTTDSKGRFYQGLLAPGMYDISVTFAGFKPRLLRREIKVSLTGDIVPVPVSLEPDSGPVSTPAAAEPADTIRVEINTTDARRGESTRKDQLQALPIGSTTITRSFDEIALLAPGVAPPPQTIGDVAGPGVGPGVGSAGQFAVNGMRSRANNFTVDGSDNNDEDIGVRRQGFVALVPQPIESIQEFQITTLLAPAQFGRNIGAQVNAVSRSGANKVNGSIYGFFNSSQLNARNVFDTADGNGTFPLMTRSGENVLLDGSPLTVRDQSGGEDSFTVGQGGATVGGPIAANRAFYFFSAEYQRINATREKSFAVPTVEQRGPFGTGATGISVDPFEGTPLPMPLFPGAERSNGVFSLFPFPNAPKGVYGANTFDQTLPAGGRGAIFSGRLDDSLRIRGRQQVLTARYNFTDDKRDIPAVNEAIFSSVRSRVQTQNISVFLNGRVSGDGSGRQLFNQARFSFGRSHLKFDELRDRGFLVPSRVLPDTPFLLNAPAIFNGSLPEFDGQARYSRLFPGNAVPATVEDVIGPLGQVVIAGFSPLGVDVYNFPQDRINRTYQLADDLTWQASAHTIVIGADLRRTDLDSDLPRLARTLLTFNGSPRLVPSNGAPCPEGGISTFCFVPRSEPNSIIRPEDLVGLGAASNSLLTLNVDRADSRADLRYYQLNFYGQDTWRVRSDLSISLGLRYEYNTPIRETSRLIEQTFSDERLAALPVLQRLVSGRTSLYEADRNNFAPRIGVAWSPEPFGNRRISVFRAGYGIFYDQVLGAVANQSRNVFPTFLTVNFGGLSNFPNQILFILNPATTTVSGVPLRTPGTLNQFNTTGFESNGLSFNDVVLGLTNATPNAINVTLPSQHLEMPMAHHYTVSYEQQLNRNYSVSVAYVGTAGRKLLRFTTPNLGSSLTVAPTSITARNGTNIPSVRGTVVIPSRPLDRTDDNGNFESLGAVNQFGTTASSRYDALQVQVRGRFINTLDLRASYTFSKVTDDVSDVFDLAGAYALPQNSFDLNAERGFANFDVRHRWTYDLVYSFPKVSSHGFSHWLTRGMQVSTTGRFHSGQPFTVNSVVDVNLDGNLTDRLDSTQGIIRTGDRRQPLRLETDETGSLLAPFGQNGRIGRNTFRAGNVLELDASVIKRFPLGGGDLAFRADLFNFIDRANYGVPVRLLEAPGFGKATTTVTPGRRIQFGVKYEF